MPLVTIDVIEEQLRPKTKSRSSSPKFAAAMIEVEGENCAPSPGFASMSSKVVTGRSVARR